VAPPDPAALASRQADDKPCGKGAIIGRSPDGSQVVVVPLCCKSWSCPDCAPRLAKAWAARAAQAKPERFITLTADPALFESPFAAYERMKKAWSSLVRQWRQAWKAKPGKPGKPAKVLEYLAIWELQQNGYPHLHIMQRGDYIPHQWLKNTWKKLGCGSIVDIKRITDAKMAAAYVVKYTGKETARTKALIGHRRLILASRGFFKAPVVTHEDDRFADWLWTYVRTSAVAAFDLLQRRLGFVPIAEAWPSVVILQTQGPPPDDLALLDLIEPGYADRHSVAFVDWDALRQGPDDAPGETHDAAPPAGDPEIDTLAWMLA
jgi:hypothetical protein